MKRGDVIKKEFNIISKKEDTLLHKLKINKNTLILGLFVVILIFGILYAYTPTDCGNDKACFEKYTGSCSKAKLKSSSSGNMFFYEIRGSQDKDCIINIKLSEVDPGTPLDVKDKLLGRSMVCKIPKADLTTPKLEDTNKLLDSCTGPLKEGMLELIIEKMYAIIIQNMGKITTELEKTLKPISV